MKHPGNKSSRHVQSFIFNTAMLLELLVALIVIIALIIMFAQVPVDLKLLVENGEFNQFLKKMFDLIIGIELLKIYFELVGIIAIAILFLVRKYLFVSALDKADDEQ